MKVTIIGTGYVGLVTGTCLAEWGNHVCCLDVDPAKLEALAAGRSPIYEPGLEELLHRNLKSERLTFTADYTEAVHHGEVIFICTGTPPQADGGADLSNIFLAARRVAELAQGPKVVVVKSTVPVGTCDQLEELTGQLTRYDIGVASNPEFLREGDAIRDFQRPDRVVIGAENPAITEVVEQLYQPLTSHNIPIIKISRRAAEMCKYAANACLAMRVSFINEMANICERANVDIDEMKQGMASDHRIGFHFLYPGAGYGGSCFPKDVLALTRSAEDLGYEPKILRSIHETNEYQKTVLFNQLLTEFNHHLNDRRFALWGVTFKPRTDDLRESPAVTMIDKLLKAGAGIEAFDPQGLRNLEHRYGDKITYSPSAYSALHQCDALIVLTDWAEFKSPDFERIRASLKQPVIFDGRNLYKASWMRRQGFTYYSVGRPPVNSRKFTATRNKSLVGSAV